MCICISRLPTFAACREAQPPPRRRAGAFGREGARGKRAFEHNRNSYTILLNNTLYYNTLYYNIIQ